MVTGSSRRYNIYSCSIIKVVLLDFAVHIFEADGLAGFFILIVLLYVTISYFCTPEV